MALALTDKGRLPLWRKFRDDWKWKNPLYRSAWVWMLLEARFKDDGFLKAGQLRFSVCWGPKEWGMSISQTKRFLDKCVREGDISWQKGFGGKNRIDFHGSQSGSQSGNESASQCGSQLAVITILKYDEYNNHARKRGSQSGNESASQSVTAMEVLLRKDKGKVQGKVQVLPPPEAEGIVVVKKTRTPGKGKNTREQVEAAINAIDLEAFHRNPKYSHLNIDREYELFQTHYLDKNDAQGRPNWLKWSDWNKAFHNWLNQDWKKPKQDNTANRPKDYIDRWVEKQNAKEGKNREGR